MNSALPAAIASLLPTRHLAGDPFDAATRHKEFRP